MKKIVLLLIILAIKSTGNIVSRSCYAIVALSIMCLCMSASASFAQSGGKLITSYSADWVMLSNDGAVMSTSKLYITPEAYRMDGMPMGDGLHGISDNITFLGLYKQKKEYLFNHDRKLFFEDDLDEEMMMGMMNLFKDPDSEVVLGKEKVSGYACTKKKVTSTTDMMGMKITFTHIIWQSDRFEMPLRVQDEEGHITELRNINTGKPAERLFIPVSGYTRVDNMMAALGMDFGGGVMTEESDERHKARPDMEDSAGERTRKDARDADEDDMMEAMEKFLILAGGDPKELAELREAISSALGQAAMIDNDPGAASEASVSEPETAVAATEETTGQGKGRQRGERQATELLFPNSDFEHGDLTNWRASGDAFIYQPTKGDNPTARRRGQPSMHQGEYWIGTFEKYQGDPGQKPGDTQGDRPTGTLTSVPFTIEGDSISFLIGGGNRPDATYLALVVNDREVLKATGNNHESMKRVTWDVSSFRGQEGRILIVDSSDRGWGHINADDFRYDDGE